MTGRDRVLASLAHRKPDRVPVDFGSTWITTIHADAYEHLKDHFGVDSPTVIMERMQQVSFVDERILEQLEIDTRGVFAGPPELERNQCLELGDSSFRDAWGVTWQKPPSSYYYEMGPACPAWRCHSFRRTQPQLARASRSRLHPGSSRARPRPAGGHRLRPGAQRLGLPCPVQPVHPWV